VDGVKYFTTNRILYNAAAGSALTTVKNLPSRVVEQRLLDSDYVAKSSVGASIKTYNDGSLPFDYFESATTSATVNQTFPTIMFDINNYIGQINPATDKYTLEYELWGDTDNNINRIGFQIFANNDSNISNYSGGLLDTGLYFTAYQSGVSNFYKGITGKFVDTAQRYVRAVITIEGIDIAKITKVYIRNVKLTMGNVVLTQSFAKGIINGKNNLIKLSVPDPLKVILQKDLTSYDTSKLSWVGKSYVSLGDSITWQDGHTYGQGSQIGQIARGYQTIMKEQLFLGNYINKGVSGAPMANGTTSGAGTNTTGKSVDYSSTDLVTIAAGTNDFKLNVPMGVKGQIGDTTFDTNTFYGAYRDLIEYILKNKPTARIVLFTPLQRDNSGYDVNTVNTVGNKLIDYVNAIQVLGEMYGIPVIDMYRNSGITKLNFTTYLMDGLHPFDPGYVRMGTYASNIIKNL
jgi:lysophospholipase L1-like esterase